MELEEKIASTIKKYKLIEPGETVICALSGGPDSVTMTHVLNRLKGRLNFNVVAAHLNHMLRGDESERDERFVRDFCKDLGIKLFVERRNIGRISGGRNVEAVARRERYRFLEEIRKRERADRIAVGHTSSDLVETVIFNLVKGTGLKGIRGFLPRRGNVIRPLFEVSRREVEDYLMERDIPFQLDSSNLERSISRNLIRLDVVPVLRRINPNLEETFLKSCENLREVEDFVKRYINDALSLFTFSDDGFSVKLEALRRLHPFILKSSIQEAFRRVSSESLSSAKLREIERIVNEREFKRVDLKGGFSAVSDQLYLRVGKLKRLEPFSFRVERLPSEVKTPSGTFELFLSDVKLEGEDTFCFPEDYARRGILIRRREPGDWIRLRSGRRKLKRVLIDLKIPKTERDRLIAVATGDGEILWIPNVLKAYIIREGKRFICVRFKGGTENAD